METIVNNGNRAERPSSVNTERYNLPFSKIVWAASSLFTLTVGLGLRHFKQSLEQHEGLHSGLSPGSSTYVPRVPLLANHSVKALYGVLPVERRPWI